MTSAATAPLTLGPTAGDGRTMTGDGRAFWLATAAFAVLSGSLAALSPAFLEGDACTHYQFARAAWVDPAFLVNVWGRPVCTLTYLLPAHVGGRLAVRFTSLLLAIGTAAGCRAIARGQGWRWPALAAVFVYAQPLVLLHSFSELTELPFAILVALGFLAYQRRRFFWMAVAVGCTPAGRPEGFAFAGLAAVALVSHRRPGWLLVLVAPTVAWDVAGWVVFHRQGPWWRWLASNWPWGEGSVYTPGPLYSFVERWPAVTGPLVFPATLVGIWLCLRGSRPIRAFFTDPARRCDLLIAGLSLAVLAGHSVLYWRAKMASNGELRYMLVVTPFWALLAGRGWGWAFDTAGWTRPRLWAGLAAALPLLCNRLYTVIPQTYGPDWVEARHIAAWYASSPALQRSYPTIAVTHPGLSAALDDLGVPRSRVVSVNRPLADHPPPGTLLVWERIGAMFNADARRTVPLAEVQAGGWTPMPTPWDGRAGGWHVFHSAPADPARPNGG